MPEIRASGLVLVRREAGGLLYLRLVNARHGDVGLPKGRIEEGEAEAAAALRETREETGIAEVAVNAFWRRAMRYSLGGREKEVVYRIGVTERAAVTLSAEHREFAWGRLEETLRAFRHAKLQAILRSAALFLKDPSLRRGLEPEKARALLEAKVGGGAPVIAHTAQVAAMARRIAEAVGGVDPAYVECCAWLHDIGRAKTHGMRHPLEGFLLLAAEGQGGYAPCCLSHFTKGASFEELRSDPDVGPSLAEEMWGACDLETFPFEERIVALADFLAVGDRRGRIEEREADLVRRYGPSPTVARNARLSRALLAELESRAGCPFYPLLGL
ncbi:MAG: NUDIX domain-containing protein [Planctomycetaceae bacterium]